MAKHVGSLFHEPTRAAGAAPGPPGPHEAASRKGGHGAYVSFRHACTQSSRTREIFFEEEKREILALQLQNHKCRGGREADEEDEDDGEVGPADADADNEQCSRGRPRLGLNRKNLALSGNAKGAESTG